MLGKTTKKSWKIHERKFVIGMIMNSGMDDEDIVNNIKG